MWRSDYTVECELCGATVNKRNLHVHKNCADCQITVDRKAATEQKYVYDSRIASIAQARWAAPFCKLFHTGVPRRSADGAEPRVWAKDWWWAAYCQVAKLPNRVELLEQIKDLWEVGDMEALEAHLGGIELARM